MLNIGKCDVSPRLLAINPTSTYKARPLPSKIQSRSWDAGRQRCLDTYKRHQTLASILCLWKYRLIYWRA